MDQVNPAYSPYSVGHNSPAGAAVYTQQPWNYPGPPDMYSVPGSPLQPRPTAHPQMFGPNMGGGMRPMGDPYGQPQQLYASSSPGPPIQTTASNKGPDGANLFIFHIPNQFTNLDMYNLFCHFGNLLSVRIMVEKETGRSRGFGFVSYDNPESAAHAIKELNGYTVRVAFVSGRVCDAFQIFVFSLLRYFLDYRSGTSV
jgi:CUG-BP- and ETR3-like factor